MTTELTPDRLEHLRGLVREARAASEGTAETYLARAWNAVEAVAAAVDDGPNTALDRLMGAALVELGEAQRRSGDIRGAVASLEQAIDVAHALMVAAGDLDDDHGWHALAHHRLGIVHDTVGDAGRAIAALRRALELFDDAGDSTSIARVQNSLGIVYSRSGSYPEALERFEASLRHAERIDARDRQASVLSNLSITTRLLGRIDAAIEYGRRAIAIDTADAGSAGRLGAAYTNLALALSAAGEFDEARRCFAKAEAHLLTDGDPFLLAESLRCQAESLLEQGELEAALPLLERSLGLADEHAFEGLQAAAHACLSQYWKAKGVYERALEHHERFHVATLANERATAAREREGQQLLAELAVARVEARAAQREREVLSAQYARLASAHEDLIGRAAQLEIDASSDALTGLANRRMFDQRLTLALRHARESGQPCSVLLIDADHFKAVNDAFGHATGDRILVDLSALFRRHLRDSDLAARLGGEEFAVLLSGADLNSAAHVAEMLRSAIEAVDWSQVAPGLRVTASFGVACSSEAVGTTSDLIARADQRLYAAKSLGRNRVEAVPPRPAVDAVRS